MAPKDLFLLIDTLHTCAHAAQILKSRRCCTPGRCPSFPVETSSPSKVFAAHFTFAAKLLYGKRRPWPEAHIMTLHTAPQTTTLPAQSPIPEFKHKKRGAQLTQSLHRRHPPLRVLTSPRKLGNRAYKVNQNIGLATGDTFNRAPLQESRPSCARYGRSADLDIRRTTGNLPRSEACCACVLA